MTKDGKAMAHCGFMRPVAPQFPPKTRRRIFPEFNVADAVGVEISEVELERWADDGGPVRD